MTNSRADPAEDPLDRSMVATLDARVTSALPHLRERNTLLEIAALGWRRSDLVAALEALACDPTMPTGNVLTWVDERPATRELALFVRAQLGVGPAQTAQVRALAERVADPIARDLILAHVEGDADAITLRLVEHWRSLPRTMRCLAVDLLLRASATLTATRATTRRGRRAPSEAFAVTRPEWSQALANEAHAMACRLLPGFGIEEHDQRWSSAPSPRALGSLANVAPPVVPRAPLLPAAAPPDGGDGTYRAIRAGGPTIDSTLLSSVLRWPQATQLDALDGLADAESISEAALAVLEDLVCSGSERIPVPGWPSWARPIFEGSLNALCAHAPERWLVRVEELATSVSPRTRAHVALALAHAPLVGARGLDILRALELDPTHRVRAAARFARATWAARHETRLWTRRVVWSLLRDDAAAELVAASLMTDPLPELAPSELRRLRRMLASAPLSERARARASAAFQTREPPVSARLPPLDPQGPPANARLTSSDGRSIIVAVAKESGDRPSEVLATIVTSCERRAAFPHEAAMFIANASSSYMRLNVEGEGPVAVRARCAMTGLALIAVDPRILERLP